MTKERVRAIFYPLAGGAPPPFRSGRCHFPAGWQSTWHTPLGIHHCLLVYKVGLVKLTKPGIHWEYSTRTVHVLGVDSYWPRPSGCPTRTKSFPYLVTNTSAGWLLWKGDCFDQVRFGSAHIRLVVPRPKKVPARKRQRRGMYESGPGQICISI